ncbi:transcription termination-antitermination factor [nusG] [Thermoplasma volcanium GSS1]|uniref:Transcription elongation factor Spt5 n=1 Tax=Thermoplasma volcanium (strain ATCC 51530 / DSM 4299 / JCM 9571 / NBRC 15438 / GSS1) TaxID=273116 RepID=Q978E9_THEVO|nr:transcription elongation factor Spt5 [Thermoplasma volcanium]BAB60610.1 transcription termination-antitermination factor [nusG] [Thermoplasma volcanium GSS1]
MESGKEYEWITFNADSLMERSSGEKIDFPLRIKNIQNVKRKFSFGIVYHIMEKDPTVDWKAVVTINKSEDISMMGDGEYSDDFDIEGNKEKVIGLTVYAPKGASANDTLDLNIEIESEDNVHHFTKDVKIVLKPVIVALKTTVGSEVQVATDLNNKAERDRDERSQGGEKQPSEVFAIMAPYEIKGYIFVETMHPDRISYLAKDIRGYKGMVSGKIDLEEIAHYLTPKPAVSGLELGSLVELVEGPFKGEKAKIISIDSVKEEVTVQLVESMVPIPVTVKAESIRLLK